VLTLSAMADKAGHWNHNGLYQVAQELQHEITKVSGVGETFIVGVSSSEIRVEPDPEKLSLYGVTLEQLISKVQNANRASLAGAFRENGKTEPVVVGQTLQCIADIGLLLVTTRDRRPIYVKDVARTVVGLAQLVRRAWTMTRGAGGKLNRRPGVNLAIAKRKGENAVRVTVAALRQLLNVRGCIIPARPEVAVTHDYGATANEKANELLFHPALATGSIVAFVSLGIGWREGVVTLIIVPTTILLTLFATWMKGYTINRVSCFALFFSIGILVDDAIVAIENILRHWEMRGERRLVETAIEGVAEIGNPTVVGTLAIVAAQAPMMFVSGLMGSYMSPIPANASMAMLFSFFVAVIVTPWLLLKIAGRHFERKRSGALAHLPHLGAIGRLYIRIATPKLKGHPALTGACLVEDHRGSARVAGSGDFARRDLRARCEHPTRSCIQGAQGVREHRLHR
jgi:multidrug efflux pump subunit AcrB